MHLLPSTPPPGDAAVHHQLPTHSEASPPARSVQHRPGSYRLHVFRRDDAQRQQLRQRGFRREETSQDTDFSL